MEISVRQGLLDPTFGFPQDLQESESPDKLYSTGTRTRRDDPQTNEEEIVDAQQNSRSLLDQTQFP